MNFFLLALAMLLCGCDLPQYQSQNFACSAQQIEETQPQMDSCSANGYAKDFCYAVAVAGHCSRIVVKP